MIHVERVYDHVWPDESARFLVDRLWLRGRAKWRPCPSMAGLRDVAPSEGLPTLSSGHDPAKWKEFQRRYFAESGRQTRDLAAGTAEALQSGSHAGDDLLAVLVFMLFHRRGW